MAIRISSEIVPLVDGADHSTHVDIFGQGGFMAIDTTDLPNVPEYTKSDYIGQLVTFPRRKVGMLVFDVKDQKYYRCTDVGSSSTPGDWFFEDFTYIAEGRYVNETGDIMTGTLTGTDISLTGGISVSGNSQLTRAFRNSGAIYEPNEFITFEAVNDDFVNVSGDIMTGTLTGTDISLTGGISVSGDSQLTRAFRNSDTGYTSQEFITNNAVVGGNNIAISINDDGKIVVDYAETIFNPTFNAVSPGPVGGAGNIKEIAPFITVNNSYSSVYFEIQRGSGNVNPISATISTPHSSRIDGWPGDIGLDNFNNDNGFDSTSVAGLTFPNSTNWFKLGTTRIRFDADITSDNESISGVPFSTQDTTKTVEFVYGWRLGGFIEPISSTTPPSKDDVGTDINSWIKFINNNESVTETPNSDRTITYTITNPSPGGERLYFIHSSSQTGGTGSGGDSYGWSPKFFTDQGAPTENVFVELTTNGPIEIDSKYYRVWATTDDTPYTQTTSFRIIGNAHN